MFVKSAAVTWSNWRARDDRMLLGFIVFGLAGVVWTLLVAGSAFVATYQGAEYRCIVEGPHHPLTASPEVSPVSAGFSVWPMGRQCEWPTVDGTTVLAQSDDWGLTTGMLGLGAVSVLSLAVALMPLPSRLGAT
jgi:hypothetical protein